MRIAACAFAAAAFVAAATMVFVVLFPREEPGDNARAEPDGPAFEEATRPGIVATLRAAGGWAAAGLCLGAATVVAASAGALARWSLGPSVVRWLGHAAFACGLVGASEAFREAIAIMARLDAAATTADMAGPADAALACAIVGAVSETVALACAGALRLRPPKPPHIA